MDCWIADIAVWNGSLYVGDHYRVVSTLMLDGGLRYERIGQFGDELGRNSSFDVSRANPNPPLTGSVAGYLVAANYAGPVPSGVIRASNDSANRGIGQNGFGPRIGLAWQPLGQAGMFVVRAGYSAFFSQPTGQASSKRLRRALLTKPLEYRTSKCCGYSFPRWHKRPQLGP